MTCPPGARQEALIPADGDNGQAHFEVIKTADWIIDLGPEGGDGEIVVQGTPEDVAREKRSYTGQFLKPVLARDAGGKRKKRVEAAE